ncbi:HAD family hydrolase [bacterium]|nr:HAD family hydrolase [bacterium]
MEIELVIFDLDGTLLNSIGDLSDSANSALKHYGYPTHSEQEYMEMIGAGISELVYLMVPVHERTSDRIHHFVDLMEEEYQQRWANRTVPYPGIPEMLDILTSQSCKMAVLSNKPNVFIGKMVRKLLSNWSFDPFWGARDGIPRKPDPTAAKAIANQLHCPVERCLFVGDSEVDIKTANAAGMISVGVTWGFRSREQLELAQPDVIIDHPSELLETGSRRQGLKEAAALLIPS